MKYYTALVRNEFEIDNYNTYLAPIIQKVDKGRYNHAIVIAEDETGKWVYHAQLKVKKERWEDYVKQCNREIKLGIPKTTIDDPKAWLDEQVGKWYDIPGLVLVGYGKITGHMPKHLYHKHRKRFFCTEFDAAFAMIPNEPEQTPYSIDKATDYIDWVETIYTMKNVGEVQLINN